MSGISVVHPHAAVVTPRDPISRGEPLADLSQAQLAAGASPTARLLPGLR